MKIRKITLYTDQIEAQKSFYHDVFGFDFIYEDDQMFTIQVGWTEFSFQKSQKSYKYHYCFLIPSNLLNDAILWFETKLDLIKIEDERIIERFESWNANSIYFYDAAGNIAEFIVRHDLNNEKSTGGFDISDIVCVNEIGMTSNDISKNNQTLESQFNSKIWRGNAVAFGANGTQEGLFLLINYTLKKTWFPTSLPTQSCPFFGDFEFDGVVHQLEYRDEVLFSMAH